jgi:hypothetical protein
MKQNHRNTMKNIPGYKALLFSKAFFLLFLSAQAHSSETANVDCVISQDTVAVAGNNGCHNDAKTPLGNFSGSVAETYEYDALGRLVKV